MWFFVVVRSVVNLVWFHDLVLIFNMLLLFSGIANALCIFSAALSDHKVLFFSDSYSRLTETSHALTALLYPLTYR